MVFLWFLFCCFGLQTIRALQCSWNYRFDATDNHFNIVYPDKNAVYFGMIVPPRTQQLAVFSATHPLGTYFSIQIYEQGGAKMHYNDLELLSDDSDGYNLTVGLQSNILYFALFRIYEPRIDYWGASYPQTRVDNTLYPLCDIDYSQQGNIYTNLTYGQYNDTQTVCIQNNAFLFMDVPAGSLTNADANYMIACIQPSTTYRISVQMPTIMGPRREPGYDLRYASISLVSTSAPRPTVWTNAIGCSQTVFQMDFTTDNNVPFPAFLYRQLLPSPDFDYSIAAAKTKCFDYVENRYDDKCIQRVMGSYYPKIELL